VPCIWSVDFLLICIVQEITLLQGTSVRYSYPLSVAGMAKDSTLKDAATSFKIYSRVIFTPSFIIRLADHGSEALQQTVVFVPKTRDSILLVMDKKAILH